MALWVDDCFCLGNEDVLNESIELLQRHFKIKIEDDTNDYLSCEILYNKNLTKCWIGQPHMVKKIIKTFGEEINKRSYVDTPGTPGLSLIKEIDDDNKIPQELQSRYRTGVGMLLFLIKHSRPDLCNGVRELSKCLDGANEAAYKEMLRIIKYVMDTRNKGLKISPL